MCQIRGLQGGVTACVGTVCLGAPLTHLTRFAAPLCHSWGATVMPPHPSLPLLLPGERVRLFCIFSPHFEGNKHCTPALLYIGLNDFMISQATEIRECWTCSQIARIIKVGYIIWSQMSLMCIDKNVVKSSCKTYLSYHILHIFIILICHELDFHTFVTNLPIDIRY